MTCCDLAFLGILSNLAKNLYDEPIQLSKEFTIRDSRAVDLYFSEIQR